MKQRGDEISKGLPGPRTRFDDGRPALLEGSRNEFGHLPLARPILKSGKPLTDEALKQAAELVRKAVDPISDVRATAEYRSRVTANLIRRLAVAQTAGMLG